MLNSLFPIKQTKSFESKLSKHWRLQILLWSHVPKTRGTIDNKAGVYIKHLDHPTPLPPNKHSCEAARARFFEVLTQKQPF